MGGHPPAPFASADQWALVAGNPAGANILAQSGGLSVTRFAAGWHLIGTNTSVVGKPLAATLNFLSAGFNPSRRWAAREMRKAPLNGAFRRCA